MPRESLAASLRIVRAGLNLASSAVPKSSKMRDWKVTRLTPFCYKNYKATSLSWLLMELVPSTTRCTSLFYSRRSRIVNLMQT